MSGTTLITIGALGSNTITTSGTYDVSVGALSKLAIEGTSGSPVDVTVSESGLLGLGILTTTDISYGSEDLTALVGLSALSGFNLGETGAASVTGHGTLELGSGLAGITALDGITFYGADDKLILDPGLNLNILDSLHSFSAGDTIELKNITTATQAVWQENADGIGGTITLENASGSKVGDVILADGSFSANQFQVYTDPNGGVDVTVCFLEGTKLLGLHGDIAVEDMEPGDRLITSSGAMRPARWIGKRTIDAERHPRPETVWPIRIEAGAIDHGLPERTLYLSPDHALYLDGMLVPAKALVNGRSIVQEKRRHIAYYHVELETHDILLAESLPVESYLETGNRNFFENGGGAVVLHPNMAQAMREAKGCAPFVETGEKIVAIRARIMARLPALHLTTESGLNATSGGSALEITAIDALTFVVTLPEQKADIVLASRSFVPSEMDVRSEDRRHLGLDVARLSVEKAGMVRALRLDDAALTEGWHASEGAHRWTDGKAVIPAALLGDADALIVRLQALTAYPAGENREDYSRPGFGPAPDRAVRKSLSRVHSARIG